MKKLVNLKHVLLLALILSLVGCMPIVLIITPSDGEQFATGALILFTGYARDLQEGDIPSASLAWTSSKDGDLGTGILLPATLTEGEHVITLTATNSKEEEGTATVTITVGKV